MTPEYMRGRQTYEDEIEDAIIKKKPYYMQPLIRGQTRGRTGWFKKKVANTEEITGKFKCITVIETPDSEPKEVFEKFKEFLTPVSLVARVYILKAKSLTPMDDKNSDPYLFLK